eukprot:scaffold73918_cov72-Phaeocystis_antarctica.AAC.3
MVSFNCLTEFVAVVVTPDRVDLACYRRGREGMARLRHDRQRLPAIGLRVINLRLSKRFLVVALRNSTQGIQFVAQNHSGVGIALRGHAGDLAPQIERRVVGPHRPEPSSRTFDPTH